MRCRKSPATMGPIDFFFHILGFIAPALAVGLALALVTAWTWRGCAPGAWRRDFLLNTVAGVLVLAAGLAYFGVDGKMATYAALVAAAATTQWLCSRAWKG